MYKKFAIISLMMFGCVAPAIVTPPIQPPLIVHQAPPPVNAYTSTPTPIPAPLPLATPEKVIRKHIQIIIISIGDKDWDNTVKDAVREWNIALGFEVFVYEKSYTKITVTYENRASETNIMSVGTYSRNNCTNSKIRLFKYFKKSRRKVVALHELGHALGLSHSEYPQDVMHKSAQYASKLSDNDIKRALTQKINCL